MFETFSESFEDKLETSNEEDGHKEQFHGVIRERNSSNRQEHLRLQSVSSDGRTRLALASPKCKCRSPPQSQCQVGIERRRTLLLLLVETIIARPAAKVKGLQPPCPLAQRPGA